jgi:mitochondrial import receptor subunit TOM40
MAGFVPPGTTLLGNEATSEAAKKINEVHKKVDYLNLPCPIPYEELHREALSSVSYLVFYLYFRYRSVYWNGFLFFVVVLVINLTVKP